MGDIKKHIPKRTRFQIDRLACKKEVIRLIISGESLEDISNFVKSFGEECSKSAVDRYIRKKFLEGKINSDGTIDLKEKEGLYTRFLKYPSEEDNFKPIETKLYIEN